MPGRPRARVVGDALALLLEADDLCQVQPGWVERRAAAVRRADQLEGQPVARSAGDSALRSRIWRKRRPMLPSPTTTTRTSVTCCASPFACILLLLALCHVSPSHTARNVPRCPVFLITRAHTSTAFWSIYQRESPEEGMIHLVTDSTAYLPERSRKNITSTPSRSRSALATKPMTKRAGSRRKNFTVYWTRSQLRPRRHSPLQASLLPSIRAAGRGGRDILCLHLGGAERHDPQRPHRRPGSRPRSHPRRRSRAGGHRL